MYLYAQVRARISVLFQALTLNMSINTTATNNKDAYIDGYSGYVNNNYGSQPYLSIYNYSGWQIQRSLIGFTLPTVAGTITDVKLKVYSLNNRSQNNTARYVNAHQLNADFTESTVTWNNAPSYNATVVGRASVTQVAGWYTIPLMGSGALNPLTLNWGDYVKLLLKADIENTSYDVYLQFSSKEYTTDVNLRPYLEITYTSASTGAPCMLMALI